MPNIVLIDDSKAVTYIVKKFLESEGYGVVIANNAYRGLDVLRKETPDLVITDIMMPGMDGFEFAEVMKNDEKLKSIPLIFFTAKGDISDEFHGYMTGAEYYITKPVKKRELLDKIEKCLGLKNKEEDLGIPTREGHLNSNKGGAQKKKSQGGDSSELLADVGQGLPSDLGLTPNSEKEGQGLSPGTNLEEIINIYGSMIEVMWAFSFDKLLTFENLNIIETAIDKTCLDFPFMAHMAFSEDGIDLTGFKEKVKSMSMEDINHGFTSLISNFFEIIIDMSMAPTTGVYTVCLLGDDPPLIADLEAALSLDGYDVQIAQANDTQALESVMKENPKLVIMAMQKIQAPEQKICRDIRERINKSVPVILVSNSGDREARRLGFEAGADEVMSLPWSKLTLLRMIKKTLHS